MVAPLPSQTITGTTAADIRASTPGTDALVETFQAGDTITLNNDGDYALAGDGADTIYVGGTASVSLQNSVVAGFGQDTIYIGSAAASLATNAAYIAGNQGNDYITFTAGASTSILNAAFVGGGLNDDTIALANIRQYINTSVKGGDNADSIVISSGISTNTLFEGNKGADVLRYGATATNLGSLGGGGGHDTITIGTGALAAVSWVNGGAGLDSIVIGSDSTFSTLAGGGLADTITFGAGFAGGKIYGDVLGTTTSGSGTGGTADGNDLIGSTATDIAAAASVWGAGGDDTIKFGTAAAAAKLYGGDGADLVTLVGSDSGASLIGGNGADTLSIADASGAAWLQGDAGQDSIKVAAASALTIAGGAGLDTIVFTNSNTAATNVDAGSQADNIYVGTAASALTAFNGSGTIAGGDGADNIAALGFASAGFINGGAGEDSISFAASAGVGDFSAFGTINGGAGTDMISFAASAGLGGAVSAFAAFSAGLASVKYEKGDVISLVSTAAGQAFTDGTVNVITAGGLTAASLTAAGSLAVYEEGTDTYFAYATSAGTGILFKVTGKGLVTTSATGNGIAVDSSRFSFTLGGTQATGLTITLA